MKKILLGTVGLAAMLASPAMAADMRLPPPPPPVVYYDWSGAYVGGNVGGIWSTVDQTFPSPLGFGPGPGSQNNFSTSPNEGIFGFHAGAQWQWGAWVLGVEAALSGCFQECQAFSGIVTNPANTFFEHKITNLFTVGPRLGYAWDRLMIFGTGGWASANLKSSACSTAVALNANNAPGPCDGPGSRFNGAYAQRRLVCRRRLRLHGPQGPAGRRDPRRRISTFRRGLKECVLLQPRLRYCDRVGL